MPVNIVGTPLAINDGTNYTAELGSDRAVVAVVAVDDFSTVTFSPTLGGQAFTQALYFRGSQFGHLYIGYIKESDIPSGANSFSLNPSEAVNSTTGTIYTLSGVDQTTIGSSYYLDDAATGSQYPVLNITGVDDGVAVAIYAIEETNLIFEDAAWTARSLNVSDGFNRIYTADKSTTAGADTFEPSGGISNKGVLGAFVLNAASTPSRSITNIDGDNDVQAGQTNITVTTVGMDSAPTVKTATLGGESLTVVSAGETSWVVSAPLHIDLEWGATHDYTQTDDTGPVTLAGVTLSAPTGWETVAFTTAPDAVSTESFYEYAQTDTGLGGAGYTMLAGDILAWETQTGLTIDGQTIPQVDPPATVSGSYKIFKDATKAWTSVSTFTVNDLGFPGDPAPVLSSPTGAATGAATASGTVTTDNGTGTLYYYASTNSTETAATIKASGSSQVVGAVGSQGVGVTGLTPETLYYLHYVQDDDGAQESNVVSSSSFTTLATSDVPATSRTSIFHIANYLRSLGTYNSSQCNELVVEWLVSEGITRTQINQMLYGYLGGLGYTGSFNDRLKAWSEDV